MPAPPGQLKSRGQAASSEPEPKKPMPEVVASPNTQLFAELAKRQAEGGPVQRQPVPNEFGKADYGVNKGDGSFGISLKRPGEPTSPRVNNTSSVPKEKVDMFNPPKREWSYKSNPRAGIPIRIQDPGSHLAWQLSGPEEILTTDDCEFKLTCKNRETKASHDYDPRKMDCEIWPVGKRSAGTPARILKANAGLFVLQFGTLRNPGDYEMNIWIDTDRDRRPIYSEETPIPLLVVGEFSSDQDLRDLNFACQGDGFSGGEVGKPCHFKIYCRDSERRPVDIDLSKLKVNLSQPGKAFPAQLSEDSKGCFSAMYKPEQDGEWKITITYQGQDVVVTTMNITGRTEGSQCYITKPPKAVKINTPSLFIMQARDRMGNVMSTGGETFKSSVAGPPGGMKDFRVNDSGDGSYQVKFTLTVVGDYEFTVTLRGKNVDGSPLIIRGTSV